MGKNKEGERGKQVEKKESPTPMPIISFLRVDFIFQQTVEEHFGRQLPLCPEEAWPLFFHQRTMSTKIFLLVELPAKRQWGENG